VTVVRVPDIPVALSTSSAYPESCTAAFGLAERPTDKALRTMALAWQPERSIAARLLWAFYGRRNRRQAIPVV